LLWLVRFALAHLQIKFCQALPETGVAYFQKDNRTHIYTAVSHPLPLQREFWTGGEARAPFPYIFGAKSADTTTELA